MSNATKIEYWAFIEEDGCYRFFDHEGETDKFFRAADASRLNIELSDMELAHDRIWSILNQIVVAPLTEDQSPSFRRITIPLIRRIYPQL